MSQLSPDTRPEAERIHISLLRKASVAQRLELVNSLVKTTRFLSWQGVCARYPQETEQEHARRFISLLYSDVMPIEHLIDRMGKISHEIT